MKTNIIQNGEQLILLLETLTRNRALRCCHLKWSKERYSLINMPSSYLLSYMPLKMCSSIIRLQCNGVTVKRCTLKFGPHNYAIQNQKTISNEKVDVM
jgi:hypothetical protein